MDRYQKVEKLGEGSYGIVYKAKDKITGMIVALKRIRLDKDEEGVPFTAIREISFLKEMKHPNIVRLYDVIHSIKKLTLIFEYVDFDLKKYTDIYYSRITPHMVKQLMQQLFMGIAYCHQKCILHRDLKPQNLLVSKKCELKIADFGLARTFGIPVKKYSKEVVTLWYRAPDILLGFRQYDSSIDIWSAGCIFAEIVTNRPLFQGRSAQDQLEKIFRILGTPEESTWPGISELPDYHTTVCNLPKFPKMDIEVIIPGLEEHGYDLLRRCLEYSPNKRITALEALQHPYFSEVKNLSYHSES